MAGKQIKAEIVLGGKVDGSLLKSMSSAEKQMALLKRSAGSIHKVAGAAARAAGVAMAAAGAASVKIVKDSVAVGKQFDSSMAQVAATMGKSVDEIGDLRQFALDMGKSTMFSASQAADALNYMALAGYDADTSMKMLPNVLNLAAAGGMELADASDMVTDASAALGLSIGQTADMVDQMASASSHSNATVAELGEAMLQIGGTAKMLSGGTVELSTALGILADNGTKGAEGGTALRNIMLSLGAPTDKAAQRLSQLGVDAYDSEGRMRALQDVMGDFNQALSTMTDEQQTQAIRDIFNKNDIKDVQALLGTSAERWRELSSAIDDSAGAAEAMAKTQMDNLAGDITYFQSAMEVAQITLSDALTPALREFVQFGTEEIGELTDLMRTDEFQSFAGDFARDITGAAKSGVLAIGELKDGFAEGFDADGFMDSVNGVGQAIAAAFGAGSDAPAAKTFGGALAGGLNLAAEALDMATPLIGATAGAVKFLADNADVAVPVMVGVSGAFVAISGVSGVAGVISTVGTALGVIGVAGPVAGAGLTATAGGGAAAGAAAAASAAQLIELGGAVLMIGGGVALAALGLGVMAQAAIAVAEAGPGAAGVLLGLVAALFAVGAAAYFAGPAFTMSAPGLLAFGAAALMVGVGVGVASAGLTLLAGQLPTIATYGMAAGPTLLLMGAGLLLMGAGAFVAGAGLLVAAPGLIAFSAAALPAAGGVTALSGAIGLLVGGIGAAADGVGTMGWGMQSMADNGLDAIAALNDLSGAASAAGPAVDSATPPFSALGMAAQDSAGGLAASAGALQVIVAAALTLAGAAGAGAAAFGLLSANVQAVAGGSMTASVGLSATGQAASMASGMLIVAQGSSASMAASLLSLSGATSSGVGAFWSFAGGVSSAMGSAERAVWSACSAMRSAVSGMHLHIPTITVGALPHFHMSGSFDPKSGAVPTIGVSYYAKGGFTDGPIAIAGEAGPEAVISFDPRYREQNIAYWLTAGEMLGLFNPFAEGGFTDGRASDLSIEIASPTGSLATAARDTGGYESGGSSINFGGVTFAPQITVSGADKQDIVSQLKRAEADFFDMLDDWANEREEDYAPVF